MIIDSYKVKTEYKRNTKNGEVSYFRYKTVYNIKCDICNFISSESLDKGRTTPNKKHLCIQCRGMNLTGLLRRQHDREKEDPEKIGTVRIHKSSKYPEVYAGIDTWHTTHQSNWARQHIYVMEEYLGYRIPDGYVVHHIDGNKRNNVLPNLVLLTVTEHNNAHAKSESLIFQLVLDGIVIFNRESKLYEFSNKYVIIEG